MKNFINTVKKNWISAMVVLIVTTSITQCNKVVDYFDEGVSLKKQKDYDNKLDSALAIRFKDPVFMTKYVVNSPFFIDQRRKERASIVDDVKHQDSTKLKMSAYVSSGAGMDKKAMMDSMIVLMNMMKKGRPVRNEQCIYNSKKYGRGLNQLRTI